MKRKSALRRMIVWTIIALVLCAALIYGLDGGSFLRETRFFDRTQVSGAAGASSDGKSYSAGEYSVAGQTIRNVEVDWISGLVEIVYHDGDAVTFSEAARRDLKDNETLRYKVNGNTLKIDFCESNRGLSTLFGSLSSKTLTLYLPESARIETLDIESVSGDIDIDTRAHRISSLDLDIVSGSIVARGQYDEIDIDGVSGNIHLYLLTTPESLNVDQVSGNTDVYLTKDRGFTAQLDTISGSLTSDFAQSDSRRKLRFGDEESEFQFDSVSGTVRILYGDTLLTPVAIAPVENPVTTSPAPTTESKDPIPSSHRRF